jgi:hypothetical protein
MDELIIRDWRWLIAGIIILWISGIINVKNRQLLCLIAFGYVETDLIRVSLVLKYYQWLSIPLILICFSMYLFYQSFYEKIWYLVGIWTFYGMHRFNKLSLFLSEIEKRKSFNLLDFE